MGETKIEHPLYTELIRRTVPESALRKVVEHHKPAGVAIEYRGGKVQWTCHGCDWGSYAEDGPEGPCSTLELIADALGVEVPE